MAIAWAMTMRCIAAWRILAFVMVDARPRFDPVAGAARDLYGRQCARVEPILAASRDPASLLPNAFGSDRKRLVGGLDRVGLARRVAERRQTRDRSTASSDFLQRACQLRPVDYPARHRRDDGLAPQQWTRGDNGDRLGRVGYGRLSCEFGVGQRRAGTVGPAVQQLATGFFIATTLPWNTTWQYLDNGSDQGTAWRQPDFVPDANWKQGEAELGYGDGDETTVIGYGGDDNNRYITTYFRHEFQISGCVTLRDIDPGLGPR